MTQRTYRAKIKIDDAQGYKYDTAKAMDRTAGEAFVKKVSDLLAELEKKPLGKKLVDEIAASGKDVILYCADAGNGSAAIPHPGTVENEMQRFVRLRQIPDKAVAKLKKENPLAVVPEARYYAAEVHAVIEKSKAKREVLAQILGLSLGELADVELGQRGLTDQQYFRFALFLYPHLTPGDGCSVSLRFDAAQAAQDPNDTELIILGHELVHTWRMVTGMRIFEGGWEEEAMTVGLPPFTNLAISENLLRVELNLNMRTSYTARCTTNHFQVVKDFEGGKGVWPEHLRIWEDWKAKNPKLAGKDVKITPTSVFTRGG